jgi:hypothetical protein
VVPTVGRLRKPLGIAVKEADHRGHCPLKSAISDRNQQSDNPKYDNKNNGRDERPEISGRGNSFYGHAGSSSSFSGEATHYRR